MSRVLTSIAPSCGLGLLGRYDRSNPQPRFLSSALLRHLIMGSVEGGQREHTSLPDATLEPPT
jgi:hypothetical protein